MDVSPAKRSYFTCANVWWKLLFHSTRKKNILIIKTETTNSEELVVPVFIVYMFYFLCRLSAILCNKFLNLFASWHYAESTLAGSDKRCACVCEGKHFH